MRVQDMPFLSVFRPCRAVLLWLASGALSIGHAQVATNITPTGGAGDLGTTVTQAGPSFEITGGTRPNSGPNLFHSFGRFSVGTGDTANFLNDSGLATENILSRVSGGNPSNIFGTLQTTGFSGADLYLLNPSGALFGPTASLNVEGGFHVSTADFIELADGVRFNATPSLNDPLLSVAPPAAFGFLGRQNPAPIEVNGSFLNVPESKTLSLVGGDIRVHSDGFFDGFFGAGLFAPAGRVNLASVGAKAAVTLRPNDLGGVEPRSRGGTVTLSDGSFIATRGEGGDSVFIRCGQFVMDGALIDTATLSSRRGGDVVVDAGNVLLSGSTIFTIHWSG